MRTISGCILVLLLTAPGLAEPSEAPAEAGRAALAALPAPDAARGFAASGSLRAGPLRIGRFSFEAAAVDGRWRFTDVAHLDFGQGALDSTLTSEAGADLLSLQGSGRRTEAGVETTFRWTREDGAYRVDRTEGAEKAPRTDAAAGEPAVASLSAVLLFLRLAPERTGEFELPGFDPDPQGGRRFDGIRLSLDPAGLWRGRPAFTATRQDERRMLTIALSKDRRELLGIRMVEARGVVVDFVVGSDAPGADPAKLYEPPAATPEAAALAAALALTAGDAALLDRIADWPSIHAELRRRVPEEKPTVEQVRELFLARVSRAPGKRPRREVAPFLAMVAPSIATTRDGEERATVKFPEALAGLTIAVRKRGAEWRLSALPGD